MSDITACPLDCYDACKIIYEQGKLKGVIKGYTKGFLCPHMNHYDKYQTILKPRYKGEEVSLEEALEYLKKILISSNKDKILHYRGSGNFALMQEISDHFFASYGAVLTNGNLCDGAGEAGIQKGRGSNLNMPLSEIEKSQVVIFWGRNPHTTSSHILPLVKDKTIIVIDPIKIKIAKKADLYVQLKPHGDLAFALLLSHFLYVQNGIDKEYLKKYAKGHKDFCKLIQNIKVQTTLQNIDVTLIQIYNLLDLIKGKRVAIVCGVGIQKYKDGADVIRAIDAFAVMLGLFVKEGCGVAYLGNSKDKITLPFNTKAKKVSRVNTKFSNFKTVFIQGANPLSQMPDTLRVRESMKKVQKIIYFGLYENETSQMADLVIPAKSFLYKNDVRTSYSHNAMMFMPKVADIDVGISEYDLSTYLCREFDLEIEDEDFYINYFKEQAILKSDECFEVKNRKIIPYKNGFDTLDKQFVFLKEFDINFKKDKDFFLITPKSSSSLNSQFKRQEGVYLHSSLGYKEGKKVLISSLNGTVSLKVRYNDDLRKDTVLIYSGTKGVNNLTSSQHSLDGTNAVYQEDMVEIFRDN